MHNMGASCGMRFWAVACDAVIKNLAARRAVCYVVVCKPERLLLCADLITSLI